MNIKQNIKKDVVNRIKTDDSGYKINYGIAIILLSPLLGSLLFYIYSIIIGFMISTDGEVEMFWFSCIFVMALLGLALVLVGCNEKTLHKHNS
ncbi:hypothetical protein [Clostridium lundense]|uniref:hypothetical protein n=1 Tax=Clostridium lundense TaxID=319475 RepID=UPI00048743EC|nr:hypothetical protein [Clostridium lundense]